MWDEQGHWSVVCCAVVYSHAIALLQVLYKKLFDDRDEAEAAQASADQAVERDRFNSEDSFKKYQVPGLLRLLGLVASLTCICRHC